MHELALTQGLLKTVIEHADGKAVETICLKLGLLSCVDGRAIQNCFEAVKVQWDQLKAASIEIDVCRPNAQCRDCQHHFQLKKIGEPCQCGSLNYALEGGEELTLNSITFVSPSTT